MAIAWGYLAPIEQAQLLHFRPDLQFERDVAMGVSPKCPKDGCGGNIYYDDGQLKCLLCDRVFDKRGEEIKPVIGDISDMRQGVGFRHG